MNEEIIKSAFTLSPHLEGSEEFRCTDGENEYALNVTTENAEFFFNRRSLPDMSYDYDGNGTLNISDVVMMLDMLAGQTPSAPSGSGINAPQNISDVTALLNILSTL